jgi:hypothetical protein
MLHDEFEIAALADELFLAAVLKPRHRAPQSAVVDVGEDVTQVGAIVQIEEFRRARRVGARRRMGGDVVDPFVADPDDAAVVERRKVLLAGPQHAALPRIGSPDGSGPFVGRFERPLAYARHRR